MRKIIVSLAALLGGIYISSAAVTVQGWWHFGEVGDYYADSSGNGHRFSSAFSRVGSGNAGASVMPFGCGGPLGNTGWISTSCLYWNSINGDAAGMWNPGFNPPSTNYVIECWCLPVWPGTWTGGGTGQPWLFCSGTSGGVYFQLTNDTVSTMTILARIVGNNVVIGDPLVVTTNQWTHLAIVNTNGTQTFYVNGVQHGAPDVANATIPAGDIYAGSASGTTPTYAGYLDELRISTFAPGAFSTSDLLARSMAPNIISQPQSASVWSGGAAPFTISVAFDTSTTYQWRRGGANVGTGNEYYLNTVSAGDDSSQFDCVLNNYTGLKTTSSVATLTVVAPNSANINAYRNAVTAEAGLLAYYPGDNDTGTTLTDTKGSNNGTLEGTASWDGRTTRAFGVRSLRLKNTADGDVTIPSTTDFGFPGGNGTVEAIVFLDTALSSANETIFSQAYADTSVYYQFLASPDGGSLIYKNDSLTQSLSWAVPVSLLGRQAHVAFVFTNNTVTAYADGLSLGSKAHPSFGSATGAPLYIGSISTNYPGVWAGTIDELAVYTSALSANAIAIHNSKFLYGTNTTAPTITVLPGTGTKTLLAGGSASFTVQASGTAPLSFQWTTNNIPIPGATSATLTLSPTTIAQSSGGYGVTVSNPYGSTNSPTFGLTFVVPTNTYAAMVMADNPVAYWRLDETSGTTAFDSAGGQDGTYSGSYTLGAAALPNMSDTAVHFTGGNAEIPFSPALNPSTAFTVEFWAKPDDVVNTYTPLCSQFRGSSAREGWCFYMENDADSWETHLGNAAGVSLYAYGGAGPLVAGNWYHVVEVWDGAGTSTLYSENQLVGQNTQVANGGTYVPNPSAPLEIGVRNGGALAFNGVIDDVAIYSHALTTTEISNHWSIKFQPAAIVTQPAGVTTNEGSTVTLTAVASGFPNTYQWYSGSTPLSPTFNPDGTQKYPQDVTNATLVIAEVLPGAYPTGDAGQYHVLVSNPLGGATSGNANVQIIADTTPPVVTSIQALGTLNTPNNAFGGTSPYLVKVLLNKRILAGIGTFAIGGTTVGTPTWLQDVSAAALGADWREVIVPTSGLTPGQSYTISIGGLKDQTVAGNQIVATNVTFHVPALYKGLLVWDYYYLGTTTGNGIVSDLTGNGNFPNAPMTNWYSSTFDSDPITGGDLNNVAPFGSLGDHYGDSLSGWITPAVTTNYYFFIASDDASELDLSTDDSPTNAVSIAVCSQFTGAFAEPGAENTSALQSLVAGRKYFIRALHVEGGGGDWVKVAWRMEGDSTPTTSLTPIPGAYLSSYAPGPIGFNPLVYSGGVLTISWSGTATLLQSTNVALPLSQWTTAATTSPYQVTPATSGARVFYRLRQ